VTPTRIRVLIAEDDANLRDALAAGVDWEDDLEVVGAVADGFEAVELAERTRPDVALIDVRMPGGGAVAVRALRRRSAETRAIALTAHDDRATVLALLEAGATGYLVKGVSLAAIVEAIRRAAAGQSSLSATVTGEVIDELAVELTARRRSDERSRRREARVRRALADDRAFGVVLQPIVALKSRRVVGYEALSRFRGPPRRSPDRWFAEADEVGLLRELELAAVRKALDTLPCLASDVYLSVNVSPGTLVAAAFRKLLAQIDAERVVVEVTEHARVDDYQRIATARAQLRLLGVRLAIDDAGAGFASLRHILRLAPDLIKLDRTLIAGVEADRSRQALAAGLISFAAGIDATIVAEGIERPGEVKALTALGVDFGQGYLLGRPAPLRPAAARAKSEAGATRRRQTASGARP
jgi:EAL domain-containing protein (putative c-di-GMP-specific phosphodiesterase class I)/DNA-binding NarL/FixJ family response regulator